MYRTFPTHTYIMIFGRMDGSTQGRMYGEEDFVFTQGDGVLDDIGADFQFEDSSLSQSSLSQLTPALHLLSMKCGQKRMAELEDVFENDLDNLSNGQLDYDVNVEDDDDDIAFLLEELVAEIPTEYIDDRCEIAAVEVDDLNPAQQRELMTTVLSAKELSNQYAYLNKNSPMWQSFLAEPSIT